jgi:hypothetical protein
MSERDDRHMVQLAYLEHLDGRQDPLVEVWWWEVAEAEREFASGLAAGAARGFKDPERLFAFWRREATTVDRQRYAEDLIARVQRHLAAGTGARLSDSRTLKSRPPT